MTSASKVAPAAKRVLIFSLSYFPDVGGAEVALKEITDRLPKSAYHFEMITMRRRVADAPVEQIGSVTVRRVGLGDRYVDKVLFVPRAALAAFAAHTERPFDALWAMMAYMTFPILLLRMLGVVLPFSITLQEGDSYRHVFLRPHILPFYLLLRIAFRKAAVVQCISQYLASWARSMGAERVVVVPNGVDASLFVGPTHPPDAIRLVTASRLVHKNGIDTIIRALPALQGVSLVIAGVGPDESELKMLASLLKVADRVQFLGYIPHRALGELLRSSSIFVRPSRSEGMGNAFIEAFAAGLPVIGTGVGGITDFLTDVRLDGLRGTGWVVRPDAPEDIVSAVLDIVANPDIINEVTTRARALALRQYEWGTIASEMREKVFALL